MRLNNFSRTLVKIISAALAASLVFALLPAAALAAPAPATGALKFLCKDSAGYVYPGVGLALYRDEALTGKLGEGTSDAAGVVRFAGLGTATYWLTVTSVPKGYEKPDVRIPFEAADGKTTEYTLILQKTGVGGYPQSGNGLKGIDAAGKLNPAFDPDVRRYTLTLSEATAKTTIRPILSDPSGALYIDGRRAGAKTVSLQPGGKATVTIRVKPKSGKGGCYTVQVVRAKSTDARLAGIAASSGKLSPAFSGDTAGYTLTLANTQGWVKVVPKLGSKYAAYSITVNGKRAGNTLKIAAGATKTMVVKVRAQAGNTKTYTIKITRSISHSASLKGIAAGAGTLAPAFAPDITAYTLALPAGRRSVTLRLGKGDVYQMYWVRVNGRISGKTVRLGKGETKTVTITVKAQAGETKIYRITISRAK
jgi:hypothetical protein